MAVSKEANSKRRGIQSVGIGLRVLSALASQQGAANLSVIAQAAGLSASQAHRYLSSLIDAEMVRQEQRSGLYDLDAGAIRLGLAALSRINIFKMADEVFESFAKTSGRTCLLAIWGDAGPTIIRWFPGSPPVTTSLSIGSVLPLLRSATGRIFCAFGDESQVERISASVLKAEKQAVPGSAEILKAVLARGLAGVEGDVIPGLRAIAAPVFDLQGRLVLVASAIASEGMSSGPDDQVAQDLLKACKDLTQALGGTWPINDTAT
jgi:DNA-binding IclR family transcriptional regulator